MYTKGKLLFNSHRKELGRTAGYRQKWSDVTQCRILILLKELKTREHQLQRFLKGNPGKQQTAGRNKARALICRPARLCPAPSLGLAEASAARPAPPAWRCCAPRPTAAPGPTMLFFTGMMDALQFQEGCSFLSNCIFMNLSFHNFQFYNFYI